MSKLAIMAAAAAGSVAAGLAFLPAQAAAQGVPLGEIVVYGNDPCPRSTDDNVVVCVRRPETERYRIAEALRESGTRQERESWISKARPIMSAGNTGPNTCSAVGPGGHTGCLLQEIKENERAHDEAVDQGTAPED